MIHGIEGFRRGLERTRFKQGHGVWRGSGVHFGRWINATIWS